jgi:catechol 2,3-dioxygenase-like lactoylglutathione lyase family enzyme
MENPGSVGILRSNTLLYCSSWQETVAYYRDLLGLPVAHGRKGFVEFRLGEGAFLTVADASLTSMQPSGGRGITLSLKVGDLDRVRGVLAGRGVAVSEVLTAWGARVFHCRDPEGHRIEFWE